MKKLVVFTGAGVSEESGIPTFRSKDGLWLKWNIDDVATPAGWQKDKKYVLDFYNELRNQAKSKKPNDSHKYLAKLEEFYQVQIITQNIDNLHEQAGSSFVVHLHGELNKSRSTFDPNLTYDIDGDINIGDKCEKGSQLRPHVVWFHEDVPNIEYAAKLVTEADIFVIIGTSLEVYPAAGLLDMVQPRTPKYIIDPNIPDLSSYDFSTDMLTELEYKAGKGTKKLYEILEWNAKN